LCIAKKADVLFATKSLHEYCNTNLIKHNYFESFYDIMEVLEKGVCINA
jgi:2-hydroxy-3-keto-5-methylthiopentenyl-1-phosphate phosphatase